MRSPPGALWGRGSPSADRVVLNQTGMRTVFSGKTGAGKGEKDALGLIGRLTIQCRCVWSGVQSMSNIMRAHAPCEQGEVKKEEEVAPLAPFACFQPDSRSAARSLFFR